MRGTTKISAILLSLAAAIILITSTGFSFADAMAAATTEKAIHYYNNDVFEDDIEGNNFNFGPDRYAQATTAVNNGQVDSVSKWVFDVREDGTITGDLVNSMRQDPALAAAQAVNLVKVGNINYEDIFGTEKAEKYKDVLIGQLADTVHKDFLADNEYWDEVVDKVCAMFAAGDRGIRDIGSYTSSMYMWHNAINGNKPAVIVRNSNNEGGHILYIDLGKAGVIQLRLECGYQPIDVTYWPTPEEPQPTPPEPTPPQPTPPQPTPPEPTPPQPTPPEPTPPEPTPPEPTPPEPTPTVEPKIPDGGPQGQMGDDASPDYGGGQNEAPDTTITEEPQSPDSYTPPAPPAPETTSSSDGADNSEPVSPPSNSGSPTVDHDNGTHETHGGQDYEVVAGDGNTHSDLSDIQHAATHDTVEPALRNDSGGSGSSNSGGGGSSNSGGGGSSNSGGGGSSNSGGGSESIPEANVGDIEAPE